MKSKLCRCAAISPELRDTTTSSAPSALASARFDSEVVEGQDMRPHGMGQLDPHLAETADADDADLLAPRPQWRSGEYVVIPAQSSGATAAS